MDELAAAAAVVAMPIEDNAEEEMELELAAGTSTGDDAQAPLVESSSADKENEGNLPVQARRRAGSRSE